MDTFIEFMVIKKKSGQDYLAMAGIAVLASLLAFILFFIVMPLSGAFASIVFLLLVGVIYFAFKWIMSFNEEFEYSLVNNEIDIDKIMDRKKRKRLTTVNVRQLDEFGVCKNSRELQKHLNDSNIKKIYACSGKDDEGVYYALYTDKEKRTLLLFNPNEKMVNVIKKLNPLKVNQFEL